MGKARDEYMEPIVIVHENGGISRVYRPILTDAERAERMKSLHDAAAELLKSCKK